MPITNHMPSSLPVVSAMITLALMWDWPDVAVIIILCFFGIMRPGEALAGTWECWYGPLRLMSGNLIGFFRIKKPKMRRMNARMETRRVDEPLIVLFLDAMSVLLQRRQRIYCNTGPHFRARHDAIVSALGLPFSGDGVGLTPAGHRGGGATMYFQATLSTEPIISRPHGSEVAGNRFVHLMCISKKLLPKAF